MAIILPLFLFLENLPNSIKAFKTSLTITTLSLKSDEGALEMTTDAPFLIASEIN